MAVCPHARRAGAAVGMSVAQATEIARPQRVVPHDPGGDTDALQSIASEIAVRFSPILAVEPLDAFPWAGHWRHQSESILVDLHGVSHLFGGDEALARQVAQWARTAGWKIRLSIADHAAAAWAMAHYGPVEPNPSSPQNLLPPGHGISPLLDLPVHALRLPEASVQTLSRLGVHSVGELLRLPRQGLASRLGKLLIDRIDAITGDRVEPLTLFDAPTPHAATWELQYPTNDLTILNDRLYQCLNKVRTGLATGGHGALRATCRLDLTASPPLTFELGLFAPTRDIDHLHGLMRHRLEALVASGDLNSANHLANPSAMDRQVKRLTLTVPHFASLRTEQTTLFDLGPTNSGAKHRRRGKSVIGSPEQAWRHDPSVARLIDALSGRLGRKQILEICPTPNPLPEAAIQTRPLAGNLEMTQASGRRQNRQTHPRHGGDPDPRQRRFGPDRHDALRRPLTLFARPTRLVVSAQTIHADSPDGQTLNGQTANGQTLNGQTIYEQPGRLPARIRIAGVWHRVIRFWGPERIETDWWKNGPQDSPVRRDYYRVETHLGRWWWIFRDPDPECSPGSDAGPERDSKPTSVCWFLHGRFD
ncbi:MAG: DNA polymerase Y family protein [Planctomycetota bacterium]